MTTRTQRLQARADSLLSRAQLLITTATREERGLTPDEDKEYKALLAEHSTLLPHIDREESDDQMRATIEGLVPATLPNGAIVRSPGAGPTPRSRISRPLSLGDQLVRAWDPWLAEFRKGHPAQWRSPAAELEVSGMFAATVSGDPGSAGDLVVPDFQPGITPSATAPLTVADLFAPATTNSNLITYMKETSFVNAADTVAEGTTKPESGITFDAVSDPVRKIAHWLPVTDEMLEDVPQLRGYIDARLRLGVQLELDDQLLNGTTDAPDIIGIRNRSGLGPDIVKGSDTEADAILKAIAQVETTTGLVVSGIVLNATDWHKIQLTKTTTGDYYGSGPFAAPAPLSLWGKPVAISPSMPAGTGLVGAFKTAAVLFFKGGIKVEASNSHQDYFIKNLTALRSEIRCALAVMVPAAFAEITGL